MNDFSRSSKKSTSLADLLTGKVIDHTLFRVSEGVYEAKLPIVGEKQQIRFQRVRVVFEDDKRVYVSVRGVPHASFLVNEEFDAERMIVSYVQNAKDRSIEFQELRFDKSSEGKPESWEWDPAIFSESLDFPVRYLEFGEQVLGVEVLEILEERIASVRLEKPVDLEKIPAPVEARGSPEVLGEPKDSKEIPAKEDEAIVDSKPASGGLPIPASRGEDLDERVGIESARVEEVRGVQVNSIASPSLEREAGAEAGGVERAKENYAIERPVVKNPERDLERKVNEFDTKLGRYPIYPDDSPELKVAKLFENLKVQGYYDGEKIVLQGKRYALDEKLKPQQVVAAMGKARMMGDYRSKQLEKHVGESVSGIEVALYDRGLPSTSASYEEDAMRSLYLDQSGLDEMVKGGTLLRTTRGINVSSILRERGKLIHGAWVWLAKNKYRVPKINSLEKDSNERAAVPHSEERLVKQTYKEPVYEEEPVSAVQDLEVTLPVQEAIGEVSVFSEGVLDLEEKVQGDVLERARIIKKLGGSLERRLVREGYLLPKEKKVRIEGNSYGFDETLKMREAGIYLKKSTSATSQYFDRNKLSSGSGVSAADLLKIKIFDEAVGDSYAGITDKKLVQLYSCSMEVIGEVAKLSEMNEWNTGRARRGKQRNFFHEVFDSVIARIVEGNEVKEEGGERGIPIKEESSELISGKEKICFVLDIRSDEWPQVRELLKEQGLLIQGMGGSWSIPSAAVEGIKAGLAQHEEVKPEQDDGPGDFASGYDVRVHMPVSVIAEELTAFYSGARRQDPVRYSIINRVQAMRFVLEGERDGKSVKFFERSNVEEIFKVYASLKDFEISAEVREGASSFYSLRGIPKKCIESDTDSYKNLNDELGKNRLNPGSRPFYLARHDLARVAGGEIVLADGFIPFLQKNAYEKFAEVLKKYGSRKKT